MTGTLMTFGDSNTHGTPPAEGLSASFDRHGPDTRWPCLAVAALPGWRLVEDGLPGRTTARPDPLMGAHMDGRTGLRIALGCHGIPDILTIMLGTNDLKARFGATPEAVGAGIEALFDILAERVALAGAPGPKVVLVAPPPLSVADARAAEWRGADTKSRELAALYAGIARNRGAAFLDAGRHVEVSPIDGIHWSAEAHRRFGADVGAFLASL